MKTAGLLNADQLNVVFSNVDELIDVNDHFADILQDALESANEQGDEVMFQNLLETPIRHYVYTCMYSFKSILHYCLFELK